MKNFPFWKSKNLQVNIYVIIGIIILGMGISIFLAFVSEEKAGMSAFILSVIFATGVAISAFTVSKRYSPDILSKMYLSLGFAYSSYVIAEILYYSFDLFLDIPAYPSIADVFFFALYPLTMIFLLGNMKHFHTKYTMLEKLLIPTIPVVFSLIYILMSLKIPNAEFNFDFYYGLIFVFASSVTVVFSIIGALIFKRGLLGSVWFLLVVGILLNSVGDTWYYNLEIFGQYYDAHPVTAIWYIANMFMIYALYRHQKTI